MNFCRMCQTAGGLRPHSGNCGKRCKAHPHALLPPRPHPRPPGAPGDAALSSLPEPSLTPCVCPRCPALPWPLLPPDMSQAPACWRFRLLYSARNGTAPPPRELCTVDAAAAAFGSPQPPSALQCPQAMEDSAAARCSTFSHCTPSARPASLGPNPALGCFPPLHLHLSSLYSW